MRCPLCRKPEMDPACQDYYNGDDHIPRSFVLECQADEDERWNNKFEEIVEEASK